MSKYNELKNEVKDIIKEGSKLFDAINVNEKDECTDLSYFISNYEIWYSKAFCIVKQLLHDRLNDFALLYKNDKRKTLEVSTYTVSDALRAIRNLSGSYNPSTARFSMLRQLNIVQSCLDTFDKKFLIFKIFYKRIFLILK